MSRRPGIERNQAVERIIQEARKEWAALSHERRESYIQRIVTQGGMFREQALQRLTGPVCPHCGTSNIDRGATGLDMCNVCGGLSREGQTLSATNRTEPKET